MGIRLFAANSLIILVVVAGCSALSSPTPEPTARVVAASPTAPAASVTQEPSAPTLAYFGEDGNLDLEALTDWAEVHDWIFSQQPITALDDWSSRPGRNAVLISGDEISGERIADFPAEMHFVILEAVDLEPGERLSIIGEPGARRDQLGFLAGMMVGMATTRRSVGLLTAGEDEFQSVYRMGFIHGLRFACPRCGLVEDRAASASAEGMAEARVDALLVLPGADAAEAAKRMMAVGIWVVWMGDAPPDLPSDRLAGWVHFTPTPLVLRALDAMLAGEDGKIYPYSAETGGIEYEVLQSEAISSGRQGFIERAWERMGAGELGTGVDPETGAER